MPTVPPMQTEPRLQLLNALPKALTDALPNLQPYFFSQSLGESNILSATMDDSDEDSDGSNGESGSNSNDETDGDNDDDVLDISIAAALDP
eukprot:7078840-Ditylum_brightwellii.AAC.1